MSEKERDKMSQKVRAWLQPMTDRSKADPVLTSAIMKIADKRAGDILAVGLAEAARLSWERQGVITNPILFLISTVKPTAIKDRLVELEKRSTTETLGRLRTILLEEAGDIPDDNKAEFDVFIDRWFPLVKAS